MAPEVLARIEKQLRQEGKQVPGWVVAGHNGWHRQGSRGPAQFNQEVNTSKILPFL